MDITDKHIALYYAYENEDVIKAKGILKPYPFYKS